MVGKWVFIENKFLKNNGRGIRGVDLRRPLKYSPVFQYIGKKDMDGKEIYCGHSLIMPDEKLEENEQPKKYKVIFEEMCSAFVFENDWNQIFHCDDRCRLMRIFDHSALEKRYF